MSKSPSHRPENARAVQLTVTEEFRKRMEAWAERHSASYKHMGIKGMELLMSLPVDLADWFLRSKPDSAEWQTGIFLLTSVFGRVRAVAVQMARELADEDVRQLLDRCSSPEGRADRNSSSCRPDLSED